MRQFVKPFRRWSLGEKLSATFCLLVLGIALLISFFVIAHEERALDQELQKRGVNIVQNLARLSVEPVLQDDLWGLYKVVRDIVRTGPGPLSENVVAYAMVLDPRGEVLSHSDPGRFPIGEPLPSDSLTAGALKADGLLIRIGRGPDGQTLYDIAHPIVLDRQRLGVARIGVSRRVLEESLAGVKRDVLLISSLLAGLGMALGLAISRRMTQPLHRLSASVQALSQGQLDERVRVEAAEKDEIGLLADSFNQMAENLREKILELQATKQYLENLLENANDFIYTLAPDGTFTYVNRKFLELGYRKGELVGRPASALLSPFAGGQGADRGRETFEMRLLEKRGAGRVVALTTSPLRDNGGAVIGTLGLAKDITERQELERRLLQSEKLASIGEMAGAMAHEIRNPLGSIYTAANLLAYDQGAVINAEHLALLRVVQQEARRLNRILTDFLQFARPRQPTLAPCDLNTLCEQTLEALRYDEAAKGKEFRKALDPRLPPLLLDADQMRQSLWNVALNALQAMGDDGRLSITSAVRDGEALVAIQDTGPGIPREHLGKIFEPFYSRREDGLGLGLAIAHRVVEAHGGRIEVESEEGRGTTMTIWLPVRAGDRG
jgi:PAS domain S-box-containing protein